MKVGKLQVILKTIERCNLACTYCYYFFGGDDSYKNRPPVIDMQTVRDLADFLAQGADDLSVSTIEVIFHGGEPMLQKPAKFDEMCGILRSAFAETQTQLQFAIQTNATIINDQWLDLLHKHDVAIGVSIDGPQEYNDKYRIDLRGKGSYQKVAQGIKKLVDARKTGKLNQTIGTITVLNPDFDYKKIYRRLNKDLGVERYSFLFPDISYDSGFPVGISAEKYGDILCDIFDQWVLHPGTSVRNIDTILSFFQIRIDHEGFVSSDDSDKLYLHNQIIVIQSDGDLSIDDSLIPASKWRNLLARFNVRDTDLRTYLGQGFFEEISVARNQLPHDCQSCGWQRLCQGGDIENRFSENNAFDNRSIYCAAIDKFYGHVTKHLVKNGYPVKKIEEKLGLDVISTHKEAD